MEYIQIIVSFILGGGLVHLFSLRYQVKKESGLADQEMVNSWSLQQKVYQNTIQDLEKYTESLKTGIQQYESQRQELINFNESLQEKIKEMQSEVDDLKLKVQKNEEYIRKISPFGCSVVGCPNRKIITYNNNL